MSFCLEGCLWSRFDDLKKDAPVEVLTPAVEVPSAFGANLAVIVEGDQTSVLVAGEARTSGAARYRLGQDEAPELVTVDGSYCQRSLSSARTCVLAQGLAGMAQAPQGTSCYVTGPGQKDVAPGLFTRCAGGAEFTFPTPPDIEAAIVLPAVSGVAASVLTLAASHEPAPVLLVGASDLDRAFYYETGSLVPVDLSPEGTAPSSYGAAVSAGKTADGWWLAVGAPEVGEVRLFASSGSGPTALGCLSASARFGSALSAGDLDGDGDDDLAVSSEDGVQIYSGAQLAGLTANPGTGCSLARPQDDLLLVSLSCQTEAEGEVSGCEAGAFGQVVQIADFNGDGQADVAVAAPGLSVRGLSGAGAVEVFDSAGALQDVRFPSDPQKGGHFGQAMVAVPQRSRAILVVGEPGSGAASAVYCTMIVGQDASVRCP